MIFLLNDNQRKLIPFSKNKKIIGKALFDFTDCLIFCFLYSNAFLKFKLVIAFENYF